MTTATQVRPQDMDMTPGPLTLCGQGTRLGWNGGNRARLLRFYCQRWDCPRCARRMVCEWRPKILSAAPVYFASEVSEAEYAANTRRIRNADAEYWAIAHDGRRLVLATEAVLPGASRTSGSGLEELLDRYLVKEAVPMNGKKKIIRSRGVGSTTTPSAEQDTSAPTAIMTGDDSIPPDGPPAVAPSEDEWKWITVQESLEEVARRLEGLGCLVVWKGEDEVDIPYLSEAARVEFETLFGEGGPVQPFLTGLDF